MGESGLELGALFASAFLAATLLPAQSEMVLAALLLAGTHPLGLLVSVATAGNVLGSVVNWLLGRGLLHFQDRKWFPARKNSIKRASDLYRKYGIWTLLFAWLPIIGDPLTLVAGLFRTPLLLFIILVTIGKAARYIGVVALV